MPELSSKKTNKRRGVIICGSYGHGNAGDEAILEAIISELRSEAPGREIPGQPPSACRRSGTTLEKQRGDSVKGGR